MQIQRSLLISLFQFNSSSMAIAKSSDWSFPPCINCKNRILKPKICYSCKTLPFLSNIYFNSRTLVAKSSSCSSPVLEEKSQKIPSKNSKIIELDLELQDYTTTTTNGTTTSTCLTDSKDLNGLICSLLKDPQTQGIGYDYYEKAKENTDFRPEKSTLKLLIRYLVYSNKWGSIISLCEDLRSSQILPDSSTCCKLITSCIKARKFKIVNNLLEVFILYDQELSVLAFDSAMKGYNKLHMYSSSVVLYERMRSAGLVLDPGCYCSIMEAHLKMGHCDKVVALFQEFESKKVVSTPYYAQIYKNLCESLGKSGRAFEALEYFRDMNKKGIQEDHSFYSILICGFASICEVKMAEELLEEAEGKRMLRDPALFLKLVLMYIEEGLMEKTLDVVAVMARVKIRVSDCIFCAIVNGFSRKRGLKSAVKVYEDICSQGCEPGQVTYASVLNLYCRLGLYSNAEMVFSEMEQKGFDKCVVAYSSMIAMYGKTGRPKDAMKLVAKMKERGCQPNVWVYNALLDIHGKVLNLRQVEKIWKEMKRRKIFPDRVSYTSIISAYSRAREFDKCLTYYQEFTLNGGKIDRAMAGIMVGVFSKMNRVDELIGLLQNMKREGTKLDGRLHRSALNSLRDAGLQIQAKWMQESFGAT
uniref:Pentatricopeptide repeat-containing protein At5g13770, chloroplastic n=2 Tax=Nicotiana sylvestris TaxID=4096 RepID=A0A1U7YRK9_NICSY|nr:PREDICTED: pentatricopeptide repeat-containing protein At5g13770, chloroplastic [Nicotiana sylvestris]